MPKLGIIIGAAAITAVSVFLIWYGKHQYMAGYDAARARAAQQVEDARQEADQRVKRAISRERARAAEQVRVEERIIEVDRVVEKKIPIVVEQVVRETPECRALPADIVSLLNEQVRADGG